MLRFLFLVFIPFLLASAASAEQVFSAKTYAAGISKITVSSPDGSFDTMIWYPTSVAERAWQAGPFTVSATRDAPLAETHRFPVVLFSHGSGGAPLGHRDLAAMLARAGYIVVAPVHVGDAAGHPRQPNQPKVLASRPRQAIAALNTVLKDARFAPHVNAERIGMIGYSAGGYTALVLAGAQPNFQKALAYCAKDGREDVGSCRPGNNDVQQGETVPVAVNTMPQHDFRLKALVLMDPLSFLFDQAGLASVTMPTLLIRPQDDAFLRASANAQALAQNLPIRPEEMVVPGRHFVFIDPCPLALREEAPLICVDAATIDRGAIHVQIEHQVRTFLDTHL
ncbi:alpha/beta hydrolase family protein [Rhizobium panacihumi]|uniref:alpha/beta hydrolase family protein n=1 Tax=Rhizobium panacihumi TaxID=2008450 RepID=UPI003D79D6FE